MKEFGKRGKNAIIEDRSEAVKQKLKERMDSNYSLWRCTKALSRLSAKNGSLNSLRRQNYDFAALLELAPERDWFSANRFTAEQLKNDLCIVVKIDVDGKRQFYRAERGGDGRLIRVWTTAEGCGPVFTKRKKESKPKSQQKSKQQPKKKSRKNSREKLKTKKPPKTEVKEKSPVPQIAHASVTEKQAWAMVELLARSTKEWWSQRGTNVLLGGHVKGFWSESYWSKNKFWDVEDEEFEEIHSSFSRWCRFEGNSKDKKWILNMPR
jgi:hypothetical protein